MNKKWRAAALAASSRIATLVAVQHPKRGDVSVQLPVPKAPLCSLSLCRPKTNQAALSVVPSGWDHEAEEHHSRSHPRLLHQVQLGLHTSENGISEKFRTIREMIVSVNTGALSLPVPFPGVFQQLQSPYDAIA